MILTNQKRPNGYADAQANLIDPVARRAINKANELGAWPILLTGGVGCGKTSAAAVQYGCHKSPLWFRADDLLLSMSFGRKDGMRFESGRWFSQTETLPWNKFVQAMESQRRHLILDDLAVRSPTEAMQQSLFDLLEWRRGKPLLITSNKLPDEIGRLYDDRIRSRIEAGTVIEMGGMDRRTGTGYRIRAR